MTRPQGPGAGGGDLRRGVRRRQADGLTTRPTGAWRRDVLAGSIVGTTCTNQHGPGPAAIPRWPISGARPDRLRSLQPPTGNRFAAATSMIGGAATAPA